MKNIGIHLTALPCSFNGFALKKQICIFIEEVQQVEVKISVIVPVYNTEKYLARCLDSILNGTYKNIEIIAVNDGSTDGSLAIMQQYAEKYCCVRVCDQQNGGVSAARNRGLSEASGDFIAFVDSDDWVHRQYFEVLAYCQRQSGADIVICEYEKKEDAADDPEIFVDKVQYKACSWSEAAKESYYYRTYIWGRLYKSVDAKSITFPEGLNLREDNFYSSQIFCRKPDAKACIVSEAMYYYFQRDESLSHIAQPRDHRIAGEWYLRNIDKIESDELKKTYIDEAYKAFLAYRYYVITAGGGRT